MRKLAYNLFAIALCFSLALAPTAALATPLASDAQPASAVGASLVEKAYAETAYSYVLDEYGVLSDDEAKRYEAQAAAVAQEYQIGMYYVVVADVGGQTARNYAMEYYQRHGLGEGQLRGGVMLLVAVESRDFITITCGDGHGSAEVGKAGGIDAFTDDRLATIENDVVSYLSYGDWAGSLKAFFDDSEETIEYLFDNGEPLQNSSAYHNTQSTYGEDDEFDGVMGWIIKILGILGFPAVVAQGIVTGEKKAMKNAQQRYEADFYLDEGSLTLTKSNDNFINTTMAVVPIARVEDDDHGRDRGSFGGGFGGFGNSSVGGGFGGGSFGGGRGGKF